MSTKSIAKDELFSRVKWSDIQGGRIEFNYREGEIRGKNLP